MSRRSRSVAQSGASTSYSLRARSPDTESKRQIFRAIFMRASVLSLLRLPLRHGDRLPVELRRIVFPRHDGMSQEVLVVAVREVVWPRVRAAALLAREPGDDHALRELEEVAELERLREVGVEDVTLVLDHDVLVALAQPLHDLALLQHLLLAPEDAEVLVHRLGELVADAPGPLALGTVEQRRQLALRVRLDRGRHVDGRVRERPLRRLASDPLPVC